MVVLSVAIGTKCGRLLLCRDFSDISRTLVEDCTSSLPTLIKESQEHTFVEHNNLRLNYLPLGELFLLSINDKASNILEDIEVLRSVQAAMYNVLSGSVSEDQVCQKAIDIIFTLDDIISLGYRNISSESLLANALEMESANERVMLLQRQEQEKEANKKAKDFIKEQNRKALFSPKESNPSSPLTSSDNKNESKFKMPEEKGEEDKSPSKTSTVEGKKTLKLGTQKKKAAIKESKEETSTQKDTGKKDRESEFSSKLDEAPAFNPLNAAVKFNVTEKVYCKLDKEGQLTQFEVKGEITFTIQDPSMKQIAVLVESQQKAKLGVKVPPNFNKKMWTEDSVLIPRDEKTLFQPRMTVPAFKYGFSSDKGSFCPILLSIWLTESSLAIECEFNSQQSWLATVSNLKIKIPNPGRCKVADAVNGSAETSGDYIEWTIPKLGAGGASEASVNIEFTKNVSEDDLYPWSINFVPANPYGDFSIANVKNLENDEEIKFDVDTEVKIEEFEVVN